MRSEQKAIKLVGGNDINNFIRSEGPNSLVGMVRDGWRLAATETDTYNQAGEPSAPVKVWIFEKPLKVSDEKSVREIERLTKKVGGLLAAAEKLQEACGILEAAVAHYNAGEGGLDTSVANVALNKYLVAARDAATAFELAKRAGA